LSQDSFNKDQPISYKDAGVDIKAGDELVKNIKPYAKATNRPEVMGGLGGFGSLFEIPKKFKNPVLVSGTDGVGTKLKLAFDLDTHNTIGQDLVAMCVNDILVQGAEPLFFLDYFACGKLDVEMATEVVKGISEGCILAGCALVGGETAEMPGMYIKGEYDLAGFCVGAVERQEIINGDNISDGDIIIGIASSGPHSNGYSLIRKVLDKENIDLAEDFEGQTFATVLMAPTKIYVKSILDLIGKIKVHGLAHITGGGIYENIPRVLKENQKAVIKKDSWDMPPIFKWLKEKANIGDGELYKTFNCGVGMIVIANRNDKNEIIKILEKNGETVFVFGQIANRDLNEPQCEII
jgi:phosphoribosylformylglycinamidine cyclo-ligase|tara:strand:- start:761 stop:1813 length:1053 start_codon:yes stop_codon:yes gene_type:complete